VWAAAVISALMGCAGDDRIKVDDPLDDIRNPRLAESQRVRAIDRAWSQVEAGTLDRKTVREELKTVAFTPAWPPKMRTEALAKLASDTTEEGLADTHGNVKLMLPREADHSVTRFLCEQATVHGWADATPALIRSLSRPWNRVADTDRPEYHAITVLNPGKDVQEVVYAVFLNPPTEGGIFGMVPADRVRADAWDLLARIDPAGAGRLRLISEADAGPSGPVADIRASMQELRCFPLTGDELGWLARLHNDPSSREWWQQTAAAVSTLDTQKAGHLQLRHLEPIRWASVNRTAWMSASREELLQQIRESLKGRQMHRRRAAEYENWRPSPEGLRDWEAKLSWADCLTILVVDQAIHQPAIIQTLIAQAEMDREDRTAEYGGLLRIDDPSGVATVVLYPPRPGARRGDKQFIASTDMMNQGAQSLAHFHFHAQEPRNGEYAGPSADDLMYSARTGRTCLVFTTIAAGVLDADYYQPDGVVLDLGELQR
jgi:hypothetical protein